MSLSYSKWSARRQRHALVSDTVHPDMHSKLPEPNSDTLQRSSLGQCSSNQIYDKRIKG